MVEQSTSPKFPPGGDKVESPRSPKSPSKSPSKSAKSPSPPIPSSPPAIAQVATHELVANPQIAVDENANDELDLDENRSSSASITSSILKYRYENGRRYHAYKDGSYPFPNDDAENERLDFQHHIFQHLTFGGNLFIAPIDTSKVHRVLDCGTGTGIWAIDYADDHPNSEVIGVDLSPIQPDFVPPNVKFYIEDLEGMWTHDAPFDFIYCRMLVGSIGNFPKLFKQSFENLNPGGYIELADIVYPLECDDDSFPSSSDLHEWSRLALEASIKLNRRADSAKYYEEQLREAGFVNIVVQKFKWPVNNWPLDPTFKELGNDSKVFIGIWNYENLGKNLSGLSLAVFTRGLGWSHEQVEAFLVNVRRQMRNPKFHVYCPIYVVYAQKPLEA